MYGTIAKFRMNADHLPALQAMAGEGGPAPGQAQVFIMKADADPREFWLVAIFDSEEAYRANADSPEQDEFYRKWRAMLDADPEWHDGAFMQ
jgi:quinol monooxygenase YgiN